MPPFTTLQSYVLNNNVLGILQYTVKGVAPEIMVCGGGEAVGRVWEELARGAWMYLLGVNKDTTFSFLTNYKLVDAYKVFSWTSCLIQDSVFPTQGTVAKHQ